MSIRLTEWTWLTLVGLTGASTFFAETGHAGWPLTLVVTGLIAIKGRLVIERYMEMATALRGLRLALYTFLGITTLLVLLSHGTGETLRRLTTLD